MSYNPFTVNKISQYIYNNRKWLKRRTLDRFLTFLEYEANIELFEISKKRDVTWCNATKPEEYLPCVVITYGYKEYGLVKDSVVVVTMWIDKCKDTGRTWYHIRAHVEAGGKGGGTSNVHDLLPASMPW